MHQKSLILFTSFYSFSICPPLPLIYLSLPPKIDIVIVRKKIKFKMGKCMNVNIYISLMRMLLLSLYSISCINIFFSHVKYMNISNAIHLMRIELMIVFQQFVMLLSKSKNCTIEIFAEDNEAEWYRKIFCRLAVT